MRLYEHFDLSQNTVALLSHFSYQGQILALGDLSFATEDFLMVPDDTHCQILPEILLPL